VHETVQEIAHLLESSSSKKVELEIDISDELPLVYADRAQLRQVVMNLITNASESMGEAAGVVTIRAMARECGAQELESPYLTEPIQPGMYVILEVRDQGSGMDADTRSRMFDPFFTTKFTGRGLGLAAVLGIMRTNKGLVEVESEPGQGTLVRVYFPAAEPGAQPEPPRPRRTHSAMGGTVLLVDDEEMVRIVAKAMLEVSGFDVIEASDGAEAVEVFRKNHERIDLVLLDMLMPNLGGEEHPQGRPRALHQEALRPRPAAGRGPRGAHPPRGLTADDPRSGVPGSVRGDAHGSARRGHAPASRGRQRARGRGSPVCSCGPSPWIADCPCTFPAPSCSSSSVSCSPSCSPCRSPSRAHHRSPRRHRPTSPSPAGSRSTPATPSA
jgi:hypothetical protein